MSPRRPPRLDSFAYVGMHRYFVTICTRNRSRLFVQDGTVYPLVHLLEEATRLHTFSLTAYCFMPDHLHALLLAESDTSSLRECVRLFKQLSGFHHRRTSEEMLWQTGFFERVLRNDEQTEVVARYILENPVRAGLAAGVMEYPYSGSAVHSREQLLGLWEGRGRADGRV